MEHFNEEKQEYFSALEYLSYPNYIENAVKMEWLYTKYIDSIFSVSNLKRTTQSAPTSKKIWVLAVV